VKKINSKATDIILNSKLFVILLILSILLSGSTFLLAPNEYPTPNFGKITVPNKGTFDLNNYPHLDRKIIGIWNSQRELYSVDDLSNESVNNLNILPPIFKQYFLAFTIYSMAQVVDSTPSYRSSYHSDLFKKIILMMNSSAMEQWEWERYSNESYSDLGNGFRGPTNIMWTGHYALMELLYYNMFRDSLYNDEINYYLDDWNNSLTTNETWDGRPSNGQGKWEVCLIPCEPYIVFVQCNSIPFYTQRLYDNLHDTDYQKASLAGIEWWQENMVNSDGVLIDGYFVAEPNPSGELTTGNTSQLYPGPAITREINRSKVSSYGSAWVSMFYQAFGESSIASRFYQTWKDYFVRYTTNDMAFSPDSYYKPDTFGIFDLLGSIFGYVSAREMQDWELFRKLENWFFSPFPSYWDGYEYKYDTRILGSFLGPLFNPVLNMAYTWGHASSNLTDLMSPRSEAFFSSTPYISHESTTEGLFIYQAFYDETEKAFILTVEANKETVLTFDHFANVQGVHTTSGEYSKWKQNPNDGDQLLLTLTPGTYSFIIT
jgi:hypothetical protein